MSTSITNSCRWVPWAIAGAFAVVVAANITLACLAGWSSSGLVTAHPFDKGNDYNSVLDAAAKQDALGWRGQIAVEASPEGTRMLRMTIRGADGRPLDGLSIDARVTRPVEPLPPREMSLHGVGEGRYEGVLEVALAGQWEVHAIARRGTDVYELTDRIFVK